MSPYQIMKKQKHYLFFFLNLISYKISCANLFIIWKVSKLSKTNCFWI